MRKSSDDLFEIFVRRGADVASDHHLLVAHIKLKLKRNWTGETSARQRYDITPLNKAGGQEMFKITVKNRFRALQEWMGRALKRGGRVLRRQ